jgi:hypothetical protein
MFSPRHVFLVVSLGDIPHDWERAISPTRLAGETINDRTAFANTERFRRPG